MRGTALPEINRLVRRLDYDAAFALAQQAERYAPDDPAIKDLWPRISAKTSIETTPTGADIYIKEYRKPKSEWQLLGKSPLKDIRLAKVYYRWQVRKEGYEPLEQAAAVNAEIKFSLAPAGAIPPDTQIRGDLRSCRTASIVRRHEDASGNVAAARQPLH